jgi:lycopene cyclase domain-containing protein
MKFEYLLVLLLTLVGPLVLSRDRNLSLWRTPKALAKTLALVSVPYWIWDIAATARGHWFFNDRYVLGLWLAGLPLEEYLFFPVVIFVSIFVWESVGYFLKEK